MTRHEHGRVLLGRYLDGPPKRPQRELAEAVGVTQQTVSRWKKGDDEPTDLETLLRLEAATAGEVPVESWLSSAAAEALAQKLSTLRHRPASHSAHAKE